MRTQTVGIATLFLLLSCTAALADVATPVPDGGVTLLLLGGVLVGLEALRRRLRG